MQRRNLKTEFLVRSHVVNWRCGDEIINGSSPAGLLLTKTGACSATAHRPKPASAAGFRLPSPSFVPTLRNEPRTRTPHRIDQRKSLETSGRCVDTDEAASASLYSVQPPAPPCPAGTILWRLARSWGCWRNGASTTCDLLPHRACHPHRLLNWALPAQGNPLSLSFAGLFFLFRISVIRLSFPCDSRHCGPCPSPDAFVPHLLLFRCRISLHPRSTPSTPLFQLRTAVS